jgi:hypothetical protein
VPPPRPLAPSTADSAPTDRCGTVRLLAPLGSAARPPRSAASGTHPSPGANAHAESVRHVRHLADDRHQGRPRPQSRTRTTENTQHATNQTPQRDSTHSQLRWKPTAVTGLSRFWTSATLLLDGLQPAQTVARPHMHDMLCQVRLSTVTRNIHRGFDE